MRKLRASEQQRQLLEEQLFAMKHQASDAVAKKLLLNWINRAASGAFRMWATAVWGKDKEAQRRRFEDLVALIRQHADEVLCEDGGAEQKNEQKPRMMTRRVRKLRKKVSPRKGGRKGSLTSGGRLPLGLDNDQHCQLMFKMNMLSIKDGNKRAEFEQHLVEDIATALGCSDERIEIADIVQKGVRTVATVTFLSGGEVSRRRASGGSWQSRSRTLVASSSEAR